MEVSVEYKKDKVEGSYKIDRQTNVRMTKHTRG